LFCITHAIKSQSACDQVAIKDWAIAIRKNATTRAGSGAVRFVARTPRSSRFLSHRIGLKNAGCTHQFVLVVHAKARSTGNLDAINAEHRCDHAIKFAIIERGGGRDARTRAALDLSGSKLAKSRLSPLRGLAMDVELCDAIVPRARVGARARHYRCA
jgi:hypothetical protein